MFQKLWKSECAVKCVSWRWSSSKIVNFCRTESCYTKKWDRVLLNVYWCQQTYSCYVIWCLATSLTISDIHNIWKHAQIHLLVPFMAQDASCKSCSAPKIRALRIRNDLGLEMPTKQHPKLWTGIYTSMCVVATINDITIIPPPHFFPPSSTFLKEGVLGS